MRSRLGLVGAIAIVAVAYTVNAWFNHTTIGLGLKSYRAAYVIGFLLPGADFDSLTVPS